MTSVVSVLVCAFGLTVVILTDASRFSWFMTGFAIGMTVATCYAFAMIVADTRKRLTAEEQTQAGVIDLCAYVTHELDRLGSEYEAYVSAEGIRFRPRGRGDGARSFH